MTKIETVKSDRKMTETGSDVRGFGVHDAKRREIGATVYLGTASFTRKSDNATHWYPVDPARIGKKMFYFTPSATRAGEAYGASQTANFFFSEDERDAAVAKYFAAAEKRAQKTAAKA